MIELPIAINQLNAIQMREAGLRTIKKNNVANEVLVDAANLKEFDSSIFAVLMAWKRVAPNLVIKGAPEKVKVLSRVYGVMDLFQFKDA